jgi:hypothetical protein
VVELDFFQIFLPYSFRLIGPQTKHSQIQPWWVKIGLKVHKHEIILNFFWPKSNSYMPLVNFRKYFCFLSINCRQNFEVRTFLRWLSIRGTKFFWRDTQKYFFFKKFTLVLLDGFINGFSKFRFFIVKICIFIACACWAYEETILTHTEHTRKRFYCTLSIRGTNFRVCSASVKMWTVFTYKSILSLHGTNFIAHWAYGEQILSLAEHTGNGFHRWLRIRGNV